MLRNDRIVRMRRHSLLIANLKEPRVIRHPKVKHAIHVKAAPCISRLGHGQIARMHAPQIRTGYDRTELTDDRTASLRGHLRAKT